jgi:ribosomal protein S18 acetylase RimI-like enzyme
MSTATHHFKIESGYHPGSIGRMVALQAEVYSEIFGVGLAFETQRARDIAQFFTDYDSQRDGCWSAILDGEIVGSIVVDGREGAGESAELRWFVLAPKARGNGLGHRLLQEALEFCQSQTYKRVHLVTHPRLETAIHLYKQAGFHVTGEFVHESGGVSTVFQTFELCLSKPFTLKPRPDRVLVTHE